MVGSGVWDQSEKETAAQIAVLTSLIAFTFSFVNDGADLIVATMCGIMPSVAFLSCVNGRGNHEISAGLWISVSAAFMVSFVRVMLGSAAKGVNVHEFDKLLRNTMSLFFTGAAWSHVVLAYLGRGKDDILVTIGIGLTCTVAFGAVLLGEMKGLFAVVVACVLPCAAALAFDWGSAKAICSAAIAFTVASRLEAPASDKPSIGQLCAVTMRTVVCCVTALYYLHGGVYFTP